MAFTLTINTAGAAFDDGQGLEVARLLREVADTVGDFENSAGAGPLIDINGNKVGTWTLDERET